MVPTLTLDELQEFNTCRLELCIKKSKTPAILASILTSRLESNKQEWSSGISCARKIRAQAANLSTHHKLIFRKEGYVSPHYSILDGSGVKKAFLSRAAANKPGKVGTFLSYLCTYPLSSHQLSLNLYFLWSQGDTQKLQTPRKQVYSSIIGLCKDHITGVCVFWDI